MHNLRNRGPFDKAHLENITSTLDQTLSDAYYVRWLGPGELLNDQSVANSVIVSTFSGGTLRYPVVQFPDGVLTRALAHIAKPKYWLDGNVKFRLHWINDTATTNAFRLSHSAQVVTSGSAGTLYTAVAVTVAGINVVDAYMVTDLASYFRITNEVDGITFRLTRLGADAADTNTDSFNLVGVEMIYQPGRTVVGVSG